MEILDLIGVVCITGKNFFKIPYSLPWLEFLDLEQCGAIDDSALRKLVQMKPELKILDYYGDEVIGRSLTTSNTYYVSNVIPMKIKIQAIKQNSP